MRKVFIIQAPRSDHSFDMSSIERLGEVIPMLPTAPNMHDEARMLSDRAHIQKLIRGAAPSDVFLPLGGAPVSMMLFGSACALEGRDPLIGLYSRGLDADGRRRTTGGSYRLLPVPLGR